MPGVKHVDHGRARYQRGCKCAECVNQNVSVPCRCVICLAANRDYSRRNKRLKSANGGIPVAEVPAPPGIRVERDPARLVETLVAEEIELMPAAKTMQGRAAMALAMARVLDDPTSVPQHSAAAKTADDLMERIRRAGESKAKSGAAKGSMAQRRAKLQGLASA